MSEQNEAVKPERIEHCPVMQTLGCLWSIPKKNGKRECLWCGSEKMEADISQRTKGDQ